MSNRQEEEFYRQKYLKYKAKYLEAKNEVEGGKPTEVTKKSCGEISSRFECSTSKDCNWDAGESKTSKKEGRLSACLDKPCTDYKFKLTCPVNSKEAELRKAENKCVWTEDGTTNMFGIKKGKCENVL
jgi:hypothetical protein